MCEDLLSIRHTCEELVRFFVPIPHTCKQKTSEVARSVARLQLPVAGGPEIDPTTGTFFREDLIMKIFLRPLLLIQEE